jgi:hypothetical protein
MTLIFLVSVVFATRFPALANTDTSAQDSNQFHFRWQEQSGTVHGQNTMGQDNPLQELGRSQTIDSPNDNATSLWQLNDGIAPITK